MNNNTCLTVVTENLPAPVFMRMRVINVYSMHESESDYETAVDMVHSSIDTHNVTLETAKGLRIEVNSTEITSTYSYLEPDFDHFEETGETVYQTHADESEASNDGTTYHQHALVILPDRIQPLTRNSCESTDEDCMAEYCLGISETALRALVGQVASMNKRMKGRVFMIPVLPEVEAEIMSFEAKLDEIHTANQSMRLHNTCELALQRIADAKDAAMRSLGWKTHCFMEQTFS